MTRTGSSFFYAPLFIQRKETIQQVLIKMCGTALLNYNYNKVHHIGLGSPGF